MIFFNAYIGRQLAPYAPWRIAEGITGLVAGSVGHTGMPLMSDHWKKDRREVIIIVAWIHVL